MSTIFFFIPYLSVGKEVEGSKWGITIVSFRKEDVDVDSIEVGKVAEVTKDKGKEVPALD